MHMQTLTSTDYDRIEAARCPGACVGARTVRRAADGSLEHLLIGRAWWPIGRAPVAGHQEIGQTPGEAVAAEMAEEAGLTVVSATTRFSVHLPNLCQAPPHREQAGHLWTVFDVQVTGELNPCEEETTGAEWLSPEWLQEAAAITIRHASSGGHARDLPGHALEAVWVKLYAMTGDITATEEELTAVARLYSSAPDHYWIGE